MDVHLLVYDLSHGMARQMSMGMLGFQLDAIYHTSILIEGLEYVYQQEIRVVHPGAFSGFGAPIEKIHLGQTQLPHEVIIDYLNSVRDRYTPQAYNLFTHNCNNFTNEFSNFLLGKGIPSHIVSMPQAVLSTPFGAMLEQQLGGMFPVGDPLPENNDNRNNTDPTSVAFHSAPPPTSSVTVKNAGNLADLVSLLKSGNGSFVVVFFTSATCSPCKMMYTMYDELAQEVGNKGVLVKVDISFAHDVAMRYSVNATPTFITFLKGEQQERWSGVDGSRLKSTINLLIQMAHPPHPHHLLKLTSFFTQSMDPVVYSKVPPLEKLISKLGSSSSDPAVLAAKDLVESSSDAKTQSEIERTVDLFSDFVIHSLSNMPREVLFAVVDLLRCTLLIGPTADLIITSRPNMTKSILSYVNGADECPYALRLVTLHTACNLGRSSFFAEKVLKDYDLRSQLTELIASSLLDEMNKNVRVSASTLLLNVALANSRSRKDGNPDILSEEDVMELCASVLEAITREESSTETLKGLCLSFGLLIYLIPPEGEVVDLITTLDAKQILLKKKSKFPDEPLISEVSKLVEKLSA